MLLMELTHLVKIILLIILYALKQSLTVSVEDLLMKATGLSEFDYLAFRISKALQPNSIFNIRYHFKAC